MNTAYVKKPMHWLETAVMIFIANALFFYAFAGPAILFQIVINGVAGIVMAFKREWAIAIPLSLVALLPTLAFAALILNGGIC